MSYAHYHSLDWEKFGIPWAKPGDTGTYEPELYSTYMNRTLVNWGSYCHTLQISFFRRSSLQKKRDWLHIAYARYFFCQDVSWHYSRDAECYLISDSFEGTTHPWGYPPGGRTHAMSITWYMKWLSPNCGGIKQDQAHYPGKHTVLSYVSHYSEQGHTHREYLTTSILRVLFNTQLRIYHYSQVFDDRFRNNDMTADSNSGVISFPRLYNEDHLRFPPEVPIQGSLIKP